MNRLSPSLGLGIMLDFPRSELHARHSDTQNSNSVNRSFKFVYSQIPILCRI